MPSMRTSCNQPLGPEAPGRHAGGDALQVINALPCTASQQRDPVWLGLVFWALRCLSAAVAAAGGHRVPARGAVLGRAASPQGASPPLACCPGAWAEFLAMVARGDLAHRGHRHGPRINTLAPTVIAVPATLMSTRALDSLRRSRARMVSARRAAAEPALGLGRAAQHPGVSVGPGLCAWSAWAHGRRCWPSPLTYGGMLVRCTPTSWKAASHRHLQPAGQWQRKAW